MTEQSNRCRNILRWQSHYKAEFYRRREGEGHCLAVGWWFCALNCTSLNSFHRDLKLTCSHFALCQLQLRKFPPIRFKISVRAMNHTGDTGDRNLIKMSAERRGFQNVFASSSLYLPVSLGSELQLHLAVMAEDKGQAMHQVTPSMLHSFDPSPQQWRLTLSRSDY